MSRRLWMSRIGFCEAEVEEDAGAKRFGPRLRQRPPQIGGGRVRSAVHDRGPRSRPQRIDDPVVRGRVGREKVGCDPVRRRAFGREPARGRRVYAGPLAGREICLDRCPDDRVHEAERPTLLEDPGRGELVGRGCGGSWVDGSEAGREPKVGLAEHGRRSCQLARC